MEEDVMRRRTCCSVFVCVVSAFTIAESTRANGQTPAGKETGPAKVIALKEFDSGKGDASVQVGGQLDKTDAVDDQGKRYKVYSVTLQARKLYRVYMKGSKSLDAFVRLEDESGKYLEEDRFGDANSDSGLEFKPARTAPYRIVATSYKPGMTGSFTLSVAVQAPTPGKAAPAPAPAVKTSKTSMAEAMPAFQPIMRSEVVSQLTANDATDRDGHPFKVFTFTAKANLMYLVRLHARKFDAQVRLEDGSGKPLKLEDYGDGTFSHLVIPPGKGGAYRLVAAALAPKQYGDFSLSIAEREPKSPAAQTMVFDRVARTTSALTVQDGIDGEGKFRKLFVIKTKPGFIYECEMNGKGFDAYLRLEDIKGEIIKNEDAGDNVVSRLKYQADAATTLHVVATSLRPGQTGAFTLMIAEQAKGAAAGSKGAGNDKAPPQESQKKAAPDGDKLLERIKQVSTASAAERKKIVLEVTDYLQAKKNALTTLDANIAQELGQELELSDKAVATAAYASLGKIIAAAADSKIASQSKLLLGAAKRLELVGHPMHVKGTTLDGKAFDLATLKGKVVLVDFWASWCGPCVGELPNVKKLHEKYHGQGFEVIGISLDNTEKQLAAFLEKNKLPWPSIYKEANDLADDYGVFSIPLAILVGRDGRVISLNARGAELERLLEQEFGATKKE
jgi:thiol-disulfide isomerase/thioredoxin